MPKVRAQITTTAPARQPLSALLSQALVAYTIELDNEFELRMARAGFLGARLSLVVWTNLLRFIPMDDGLTFRDLATRSLNSRDSLKVQLGGLERWGFIAFQPQGAPEPGALSQRSASPTTSRAAVERRDGWGSGRGIGLSWIVRLTAKGKAAAEVWPPIWAEIEERWKERFGKEGAKLYDSLRDIAGRLEVDLPLGLPAIFDVVEGERYPPRHTIQENTETISLPLSVLLSQVLLAFALEFDRSSRAPLALCANVIRVLSEDRPVRVGELPRLTGASPEASDIRWRLRPYVLIEDDPIGKRGKVIRLSALGLRAQQEYYRLTEEIERDWEKRFGTAEVRALRSSLEDLIDKQEGDRSALGLGLVPPAGVARAGAVVPALGRRDVGVAARQRARDIIEQTERFLENPKESLPHYPLWDMNRGFGP